MEKQNRNPCGIAVFAVGEASAIFQGEEIAVVHLNSLFSGLRFEQNPLSRRSLRL